MRGMRRAVGVVAIVAIALHGLLLSLAPLAAEAATDPFTVICHSVPQSDDQQSPAGPDHTFHGCDHCNLCSAAAAPAAPDHLLAGKFLPRRLIGILRPVSTVATVNRASTPKLARAPPSFA